MSTYTVGYFLGSLSSTSINRELSNVLIRLAPGELKFHEIAIGDLPLYSQDFDANYPPPAIALKEAIGRSDAVLFVAPEYKPVDTRGVEERDRLGFAPMGAEVVRPPPGGRDRSVTRADRHGSRSRVCVPCSPSATPVR
jgi:hypothetical protein